MTGLSTAAVFDKNAGLEPHSKPESESLAMGPRGYHDDWFTQRSLNCIGSLYQHCLKNIKTLEHKKTQKHTHTLRDL